ncbi:hypothetical protein I8748_07420 [Nostoc sp. CENA67]|uniref:Uncharacterized protein n=1 Tax=Amazonocrinis nigriterrae CENA67 TaxID=2794033 RepID=A0A8J7HMH3_9NOST|nr:hypothetical protein [Amazonocrinis nigriterrae]MBH8562002.1 hypothetical protein [Amazonocrinis nigriterrae CENA67]
MNTDTSLSDNQKPQFSQHLQSLFQMHREDLENIIQTLARITNLSEEQIKPHLDTMLKQLVNKQHKRPFYETATPDEWVKAFREWAASHHHNVPPLSDYAVSRQSMYEDEEL